MNEMTVPGYERLAEVLSLAYDQAANGKGKERHADGRKFTDQTIFETARVHGLGFLTGQAEKKAREAHTLLRLKGKEAAISEIRGAINFLAAAVILIQDMPEGPQNVG